MRILHLCDSFAPLGGYESYLHYLSQGLANKGHQSLIVTQSPSKDAPERIHRKYYDIYHLAGNLLEARKCEFFSLPENEREAIVTHLFRENDLTENVKQLIPQLSRVIDETQPDVIHAHSIYVVFNRVLMELKKSVQFQEIPVVTTIHGLPKPLILPGGIKTTDFDQLVSHCSFDMVLGVSNTVVAELKSHLGAIGLDSIVNRMYNGVNLEVFRPLSDMEKRWDLAFMGRLEHMKAVDIFPEMLTILKETHPEIKMVITGEGSYKSRILKEFEERGVQHMVEYLGVIDTSRVPEVINRTRIFLYPSRREPFGLSVIEAMACGIPVVTANVYGPSEIVTHGKDGMTVTPGDAGELANVIEVLLNDPTLRNTIGINARKTVEDRFNMYDHLSKMIEVYNELIVEKKKNRK